MRMWPISSRIDKVVNDDPSILDEEADRDKIMRQLAAADAHQLRLRAR